MTGRIIRIGLTGHREVRQLLPWYVTGALQGPERAAIEAHLDQCPDCRLEAEAECMLAEETRAAPIGVGLDEDRGWEAMRRRLDLEATARKPKPRRSWKLLPAWLDGGWMRWALVAQACLLVTLGGAFAWRTAQPAPYQVLGAEPAAAVGNVLVIFRPETTEADLRAMVRQSGGRLVDGPTEANAYVLNLPAEARTQGVALLRSHAQVLLAEPIDAGSGP